MRRLFALGSSLVTLSIAGSVAFAKGPPAPAWCKVDGQLEQGFVDQIKKDDDGPRAIVAIVYQMCNPNEVHDADVAAIQEGYKRWTARLELTDADWREMAQFATGRGDLEVHPADEKAKWSGLSPIDQYAYLMSPVVATPGLNGEADYHYVADAFGGRLSALGRLGYIDRCLHATVSDVGLAMCQPDIDAFDIKKIFAEIRADKTHAPAVHAVLRLVADRDRALLPQRARDVKQLIAKDHAYKKMFELAAQARKDWDAHAKDLADVLALQDTMDDAMVSGSRKASEGCHDKTFKALQAAIAKLPAKSFAVKHTPDRADSFAEDVMNRVVEAVIADPEGFLAASSYAQCEMLEPSKGDGDNLAKMFSTTMSRWPGFRGPRSAIYTAIFLANLQLDDRNEKIEFPELERIWFREANPQTGAYAGGVESLKAKGGLATVTFVQHLMKETMSTGCSRSNHVLGIRGDGTIDYEYTCTGSETITYDARSQPMDVKVGYSAAVKAGQFVLVNTDIVWVAWAKPDSVIPSVVLGVPVK